MQDKKLMFRPKFATKEDYPFADTIFNLYKGGFLRTFSVGFDPKRYEIVEREKGQRGYDFMEQELWEISAVTVPANPNALVAAKTKGVITEEEFEAITAQGEERKPRGGGVVQDAEQLEVSGASPVEPEPEKDPTPDKLEDKRLEIEKRLDGMMAMLVGIIEEQAASAKRAVEEKCLTERLDDIEERLDAGKEPALKQEPESAPGALRSAPNEENPETSSPSEKETETLSLSEEQVAGIADDVVKGVLAKVGELMDKRVKYHMGKVD